MYYYLLLFLYIEINKDNIENKENTFLTEPTLKNNNYINGSNKNSQKSQIIIAIRLRPLSQNEKELSDIESVSVINSTSLTVSAENTTKKIIK